MSTLVHWSDVPLSWCGKVSRSAGITSVETPARGVVNCQQCLAWHPGARPLRLFIWSEDFISDWSSGLAFAVAENEDEARKLVVEASKVKYPALDIRAVERDLALQPQIFELPAAGLITGGA